jgi:hypothetical protein
MARGSIRAIRLGAELEDVTTRSHAVDEIARAFEACAGNAVHSADSLGVAHRTLVGWLGRYPELEGRVARIRERFNHPHEVGLPRRSQAHRGEATARRRGTSGSAPEGVS